MTPRQKYVVKFKMFADGKSQRLLGAPRHPQAFTYGPYASEEAALDVARTIARAHRFQRHEVAVEPLVARFDPALGR